MLNKNSKIKSYEKEIKRLQIENDELKKQVSKLTGQNIAACKYRDEYRRLCEQTNEMREKYKKQLEVFEQMEKEYLQYLHELKSN